MNGQVMATVLVDGMVAGTWTADSTKRAVAVTISPFGKWARGVRAEVRAEAERIAEFLAAEGSATIAVAFAR